MLPSVIGLSSGPKALALYWMHNIVRFSLPVLHFSVTCSAVPIFAISGYLLCFLFMYPLNLGGFSSYFRLKMHFSLAYIAKK